MSAGIISTPGTEYGPCVAECQHCDCAANRATVATACRICAKPIGYEARFYDERDEGAIGRPVLTRVHEACAEDEETARRALLTTTKGDR